MERIIVGVADCRIATRPGVVLITYALGSCIGLTMYDPTTGVGGLLHFMLPDSAVDPARGRDNPYTFADTGIPLLIEKLCAKGASKRRLVPCAAGGAQLVDSQGLFEIGKKNCLATRRTLWKHGMLLQKEVIGGNTFRTISLEITTGRLVLLEAGCERELIRGGPRKGAPNWHTVS